MLSARLLGLPRCGWACIIRAFRRGGADCEGGKRSICALMAGAVMRAQSTRTSRRGSGSGRLGLSRAGSQESRDNNKQHSVTLAYTV